MNPWLVLWSQYWAWSEGLSHMTRFYVGDYWSLDLSKYDIIVIYGMRPGEFVIRLSTHPPNVTPPPFFFL